MMRTYIDVLLRRENLVHNKAVRNLVNEVEDYIRCNYIAKSIYERTKQNRDRVLKELDSVKAEARHLKHCFKMLKIKTDESWIGDANGKQRTYTENTYLERQEIDAVR